jgi:hypothetical protein
MASRTSLSARSLGSSGVLGTAHRITERTFPS